MFPKLDRHRAFFYQTMSIITAAFVFRLDQTCLGTVEANLQNFRMMSLFAFTRFGVHKNKNVDVNF